jgi:hypothetical protein
MANDYNGYIATYREYQRGDHYRKALTGWGAHSSDYMATRLVTMGRQLRRPDLTLPTDQVQEQALAGKVAADLQVNEARAQALGQIGTAATQAYEANLPDDGGEAEITSQPGDTERFGAAFLTWNGGSNYTDNPRVVVQRSLAGSWQPFADRSGEVPVTLEFPQGPEVASYLNGDQEWRWTAHFEAFVSPFDPGGRPRATPAGVYRFVVDGRRREGGGVVPYHLTSDAFRLRPWSGITVDDLRLEPGRRVSFRVGPRNTYTVGGPSSQVDVLGSGPVLQANVGPIDYPDSYASPAPFVRNRRTAERDPQAPANPAKLEWYCFTCTFRPWLDAGDAATAQVTIIGPGGSRQKVAAIDQGVRWVTTRPLGPGERAIVARGDVKDAHANFNGAPAGPIG